MTSLLALIDLGTDFKLKGSDSLRTVFDPTLGLRGYISKILPNVYLAAGLILFFIFVIAGIGMITTAGNPEAQEKNKKVLTNVAIGFAIVFTSYWLVQIIQVLTGISILK